MKELYDIVLMAVSGYLLALGGTTKAWRRYVLPGVILGYLLAHGVSWYMAGLSAGTLLGVLHLGYGEKRTLLTRCSYALRPYIVRGRMAVSNGGNH